MARGKQHKKFKLFINNIKNLAGDDRLSYVKSNVKDLFDINYIYHDELCLIAAVQHPDDASNVEIIKILIENGADVYAKNKHGYGLSALFKAIMYSCQNIKTIACLIDFFMDPTPLFCMESMLKKGLYRCTKVIFR